VDSVILLSREEWENLEEVEATISSYLRLTRSEIMVVKETKANVEEFKASPEELKTTARSSP
jgi:hypothetical protein